MSGRRAVPCLLLLLLPLALAACGEEAPPPSPGGWSVARLEGVHGVSGAAVRKDHLLLVADGDQRAVWALPIADLVPGGRAAPRRLPLEVRREAYLAGAEPFAARGYQLGDLWDLPVDFQGVAAQSPDHVYVVERSHRVLYGGTVLEDEHGRPRAVRLERVATVPGGDRARADRSDWRDQGPGLAGVSSVEGRRRTEDLYVVERAAASGGGFRIWQLDRFGLALGSVRVDVQDAAPPDVGGLAEDGGRLLVVRGGGRGLLVPVPEDDWRGRLEAGPGAPGPEVEGAGPWTGIARARDGRQLLVSGGATCWIAWRRP